jgi:hypothetical protein
MEPVMLKGFTGVRQAQLDWCWAAAAASIYNYYAGHATPKRKEKSQCSFVHDQIKGVTACLLRRFNGRCREEHCANPATSKPEHLNFELKDYHLLSFSINCDGTVQKKGNLASFGGFDWTEVRNNIDLGHPMGLRVMVSRNFLGTVSHFLVIIGYYRPPAERLIIWDPFSGRRDLTLDELKWCFGPLEQKYLTNQDPTRLTGEVASGAAEDAVC